MCALYEEEEGRIHAAPRISRLRKRKCDIRFLSWGVFCSHDGLYFLTCKTPCTLFIPRIVLRFGQTAIARKKLGNIQKNLLCVENVVSQQVLQLIVSQTVYKNFPQISL